MRQVFDQPGGSPQTTQWISGGVVTYEQQFQNTVSSAGETTPFRTNGGQVLSPNNPVQVYSGREPQEQANSVPGPLTPFDLG